MFRTLVALALLGASGTALAGSSDGDAANGLRDDAGLLASRTVGRSAPAASRPAAPSSRAAAPSRSASRAPAPSSRSTAARTTRPVSRPAAPPARRPAPPARPAAPPVHRPLAHRHPPHVHHHYHPHARYRVVHGRRYVYVPHRHAWVYVAPAAPAPQVVHRPAPSLDRSGSLAVGLRMGSLVSGYSDAPYLYSDPGLGLSARYRPSEGVGVEVAVQHHDESWTLHSHRSQTLLSGSLELFAWPSSRVSPYVLGGLTYNARDLSDVVLTPTGPQAVATRAPLAGPHLGAGLEFALGDSLALDLEARYVSYWAGLADGADRGALTTTAGLVVHF